MKEKPTKAIFLGTRIGDPNAVGQDQFSPSSIGWPPFMRVNPILDWSYRDVWAFILTCKVPYCSLYEKGFWLIHSALCKTLVQKRKAILCMNKMIELPIVQFGDDEFGHMLADILKKNGVEDEGVLFDPHARTALAFVTLKSNGEREFMFYCNPSADMLLTESELNLNLIRRTNIFHYGLISLISEPCRTAHFAAMRAAKQAGILLSYDPNVRLPLWLSEDAARDGIMSIWKEADFIKVLNMLQGGPTRGRGRGSTSEGRGEGSTCQRHGGGSMTQGRSGESTSQVHGGGSTSQGHGIEGTRESGGDNSIDVETARAEQLLRATREIMYVS